MSSFWDSVRRAKSVFWTGLIVSLLTVAFYVCAFPVFNIPETAYAFAVPLLVWSFYVTSWKRFAIVSFVTFFVAWFCILLWLRHVTWGGTIGLSAILGFFHTVFFVLAHWSLRRIVYKERLQRLLGLASLAGVWVLLEWIREFLFSGFPWLPLAASQWQRNGLLQVVSWTGYYGVSFALIFFNLGLACYVVVLIKRIRRERKEIGWISKGRAEFYAGLFLLFSLLLFNFFDSPSRKNQEYLFKAGVIQPYTKPHLKWDQLKLRDNLIALQDESMTAKIDDPDIFFWSETAIPSSITSNFNTIAWVQALCSELERPILTGALGEKDDHWFNGVFLVDPVMGVQLDFYGKRRRVPFGEYVPFREWIPFIDKVVPVDFDLDAGTNEGPLNVVIASKEYKIGCLICYEDVFSVLSRRLVQNGAELLFVATNDAWYEEEAGAYQHAAHSVLRAVEARRPIIRSGNAGWSGWIDEYGNIRAVAKDGDGSVYFKGSAVFPVYRDTAWVGRQTFYIRHGDWFVALSALFVVLGFFIIRR